MKTISRYSVSVLVAAVLVALSACEGMTRQERGTAAGAVIGGVAGNAVSGGGVLGTAAGAAAGGVIGHEVTK